MNNYFPTDTEVDVCVQDVLNEIEDDMMTGTVPRDVASFGDLHDYVDANCYGGFCDDGTAGTTYNPRSDWDIDSAGIVQDRVDTILRQRAAK